VTLGLAAALYARGLAVQAFKKGPDYIDPSWLSAASGRPCRSLDPFFLQGEEAMRRAFLKGARGAQLSLIEGNHGLYDSSLAEDGEDGGAGSTAAVARTLGAPVVLVLNAARMTRSAAAMVHGYQTFEPETPIGGVILNQVAHGKHEARLRQAIESYCHIPVLGALPREAALEIPDRHLGLVPQGEDGQAVRALAACKEAAERYLDLDGLLEVAASAARLPDGDGAGQIQTSAPAAPVKIGLFRDRAFSFYYPENLEALQETGCSLVEIDSLNDRELPAVAGLYIGGGFPEVFMEELAANHTLRKAVREAAEAGMPVYAECGGLMYLCEQLAWDGRVAEMAGVFPLRIEMSRKPQGHGYVAAEVTRPNPFFETGARLRGHEFHHSRLAGVEGDLETAYRLTRGKGAGDGRDGLVYRNVLAAYTHLHVGAAPGWAGAFAARAREFAAGGGA